ncbi:Ig-like domain-containing protein [Anaerobutyricum hallii]|nr:Ig-like domain-containing protein [Anaerobutyricum hallii]
MKGIVKKVKITGNKPVKAGKKLKLKAKVTATKKANTKLLWTSSNAKYATVNAKGIVTTKKSSQRENCKNYSNGN